MGSLHYVLHDFWEEYSSPGVNKLPLMSGGPATVVMITLFYVVLVKYLGPAFMRHRKPFDLRGVMIYYNLFLVMLNGFGLVVSLPISGWGLSNLQCKVIDPTLLDTGDRWLIYLGYLYFMSKFIDYFDTIFFVLRKKFDHISGLHVFHHAAMPVFCYIGLKVSPNRIGGFVPFVNAFVHTIMYSYYALAAMGPEMKKYLWWKKHLTQLQLVQFILIFFHSLYALWLPNCEWPKILAFLQTIHGLLFFFLFFNFYRRTYLKVKSTTPDPRSSSAVKKQD